MTNVKVTREDLKRDELKDFGEHAYDAYNRHKMTIWIVVGIVAILWISVKVWGSYRENKRVESQQALRQTLAGYQMALSMPGAQDRNAALSQVIVSCDRIRNQYPGSEASLHALMLQGNAMFFSNKFEAALQPYREFLRYAKKDTDKALAQLSIGNCYENHYFQTMMSSETGDPEMWTRSMDAYAEAERLSGRYSYIRNQALLGQARLYEAQISVLRTVEPLNRALEIYRRIVQEEEEAEQQSSGRFASLAQTQRAERMMDALPTIAENIGAVSVARTQIDRLETKLASLLPAGEVAETRAVPLLPPDEPVETFEQLIERVGDMGPSGRDLDSTATIGTDAEDAQTSPGLFWDEPLENVTAPAPLEFLPIPGREPSPSDDPASPSATIIAPATAGN